MNQTSADKQNKPPPGLDTSTDLNSILTKARPTQSLRVPAITKYHCCTKIKTFKRSAVSSVYMWVKRIEKTMTLM
ncbi:hypothetical protein CHARACLAT_029809 [Characodon lateralis]|uniref:Uncharacterized protein n=1 Tax=Characodon lateralis TaxID=208331 RepID=A0ABU7DL03_9TELE|nr:hypothetical protein [Characodon lateralis]